MQADICRKFAGRGHTHYVGLSVLLFISLASKERQARERGSIGEVTLVSSTTYM